MTEFENVSIMMGAVDETDALTKTVNVILDTCDHRDIKEIIICLSPKATEECRNAVYALQEMDSDVEIVSFEQHRKGLACVVDMIEAAQGSHIIGTSSDISHDLECISRMIEGAKKDGDTIISASRWLKGCKFYGYNKMKLAANFAGQLFLRILFAVSLTDLTNPFQIVPAELYKSIDFENDGFAILLEMVLKPLRLGYKFKEIPTNCYQRTQGKSNNSFLQTAGYFREAIHIRFMKKGDILKKDSPLYLRIIGR